MTAVDAYSDNAVGDGGPVDAQNYASAILNILDDAAEEKARLTSTERAVLNILDDAAEEKARLTSTERAVLNILDDAAEETARLGQTQLAVLNILDDFDIEKKNVQEVNVQLRSEIAERSRVEVALRDAKSLAETASHELETFSYSVSHDLRGPLRAIDGFSQALSEDNADRLDDQGRQHLKRIRSGVQRMGQLIDDLLKLAGVTRAEMRHEHVDLSALARDVAGELREVEPGRAVEVLVADGLVAEGDPRLLRVAIANLLGNAWKFTRSRETARIELGATDKDGTTAYFVRDNGVGFDMTYAGKLFGAFQRLHSSAEFEGTGIGLATVHRVVARHGGRTWAAGEVDRGATFYFTLAQREELPT